LITDQCRIGWRNPSAELSLAFLHACKSCARTRLQESLLAVYTHRFVLLNRKSKYFLIAGLGLRRSRNPWVLVRPLEKSNSRFLLSQRINRERKCDRLLTERVINDSPISIVRLIGVFAFHKRLRTCVFVRLIRTYPRKYSDTDDMKPISFAAGLIMRANSRDPRTDKHPMSLSCDGNGLCTLTARNISQSASLTVPRTREGPKGPSVEGAKMPKGERACSPSGINISHGKRTGLSFLITIDHERSRERVEGRRYRHDSILPVSRVLRQRAGRGARAHLAHAHRCIGVPSRDHETRVATRTRTRVLS